MDGGAGNDYCRSGEIYVDCQDVLGADLSVLRAVLPSPLELDLAVQYILLDDGEANKQDPADPVGDLRFGGSLLSVNANVAVVF